MYNKIKWKFILTISIITTAIFIGGFFTALSLTVNTNNSKKPIKTAVVKPKVVKVNPNYYNILVLGDSVAKGTGDEKGLGFGNYFAESIKAKASKPVVVNNLAVNGDVSGGLVKIIKSTETLAYIKNSKIIFISIGGNEITRFKNVDLSLAEDRIKSVQNNYNSNIKEILKIIRNNNPSCPIAFIGLYNPFGKDITPDKINFLNDWNYNTEQLISIDSNSLFIPTYDLFKYNLDKYLTLDNFHPNSTGYKAIASRLVEALQDLIK
jgi:lysophospholipase L1-like esterase